METDPRLILQMIAVSARAVILVVAVILVAAMVSVIGEKETAIVTKTALVN